MQPYIVIGSSYGGLAAAFLAFKYPQMFGVVLSQTGWFQWHPEDDQQHHWLARQLAQSAKVPVKFWPQGGGHDISSLEFPLAQALIEILGRE